GPDSAGSPEVKEAGYIERKLQVLEDIAVPTLAKLTSGDIRLSPQERGEFAGFIALSMCRTPFYIETIDKIAVTHHLAQLRYWQQHPEILERLIQEAADESDVTLESMQAYINIILRSKKEPEQRDRAWTLMHMFQSMIDYMDVMEAMRWRLLAAARG